MLCPKCQHRNPDENRFCGRCGCDLTKNAPTVYPREGYDESDLPPVSDIEPDIPRFRRDAPPLPQSEYGPVSDASSEPARDDLAQRTAPLVPPQRPEPVKSEPARELPRSYGSSTGIIFNLDSRETGRNSEVSEPVRSETPTRRSEGIHGPSFLGLADNADPDFLDDIDDEESHSRRNWLLLALLIVIALAVVQWRNIRATGLSFAGSMKLNLPHKGAEPAKPAAETAATDTHSENGPANNGKPEIVVDPANNGANKDQSDNNTTASTPATNNAAEQGSGTNSKDNLLNSDQAGATTAKNDAKSNDKQGTEQAKNTPPANSDDANSDSTSNDSDEEPPAKTTKSAAKKTREAPAPKPEKATAGAEELARANSASSPETAAKWLWASTSKGNLDAPVRLADMYATGRGVAKDCEQANVLLRSSARRGNPRASARLGMYYATGQCVTQDRSQAWHWLSLAHKSDPNSDWITQYRQRLWSQMTPDERARAGNGPNSTASE